MAEETMVKVKAMQSLASPGWQCERGDTIEVPLADARRMIVRGVAGELPEHPLPKATEREMQAARVTDVEVAEQIIDKKNQLELAVKVRPAPRKTA